MTEEDKPELAALYPQRHTATIVANGGAVNQNNSKVGLIKLQFVLYATIVVIVNTKQPVFFHLFLSVSFDRYLLVIEFVQSIY